MNRPKILCPDRWQFHPFPPCIPVKRDPQTWILYGNWQMLRFIRRHIFIDSTPPQVTRRLQKARSNGLRERHLDGTGRVDVICEGKPPTSWLHGFGLRIGGRIVIVTSGL